MVDEAEEWEDRVEGMRKDEYCIELTEEDIKKNRDRLSVCFAV